MTKVYIASSCFDLSEAVCREGLESCHQTPQSIVSTF